MPQKISLPTLTLIHTWYEESTHWGVALVAKLKCIFYIYISYKIFRFKCMFKYYKNRGTPKKPKKKLKLCPHTV